MTGQIKIVASRAELLKAIKCALPGDTIALTAGSYGDVSIIRRDFADKLTITSLDPYNPATFSSLSIANSRGVVFDNVVFNQTPTTSSVAWNSAVSITNSQNIEILNSILKGGLAVNGVDASATKLDTSGNVLGFPTGRAVTVSNSSDIVIKNNEISTFHKGVVLSKSAGVLIEGNEIHNLRTTPISGGGVNDVTVAKNHLHDLHPWNLGGTGDHGDFVHFWTVPGQNGPTTRVVVVDNYMDQARGQALLGVYLDDNRNGIGFNSVRIENNAIINSNNQAIRLENVRGTVVGNLAVASDLGSKVIPALVVRDGSSVTTLGNLIERVASDATSSVTRLDIVARPGSDHSQTMTAFLNMLEDMTLPDLAMGHIRALFASVEKHAPLVSSAVTPLVIEGTDGKDSMLDKGGPAAFAGLGGDDRYGVSSIATSVVEAKESGVDTVKASIDFALPANVENLFLNGNAVSARGNELDNLIRGNHLSNFLNGFDGNDSINGGAGADTIVGGSGDDRLNGEDGDDLLDGGAGNDALNGGGGVDTLIGGAGNDRIRGGWGSDLLSGGAGADLFIFAPGDFDSFQADVITDFVRTEGDKISLGGIDANTGTLSNEKFSFIGASAFSGKAGELRYDIDGGRAHVYGDMDGDGIADLHLVIDGVSHLVASDFLL